MSLSSTEEPLHSIPPSAPYLIISGHVIPQSSEAPYSPHPLLCVHACRLSHVLECSVHFHSPRRHHLPRFQRRTPQTVWASRRRSNLGGVSRILSHQPPIISRTATCTGLCVDNITPWYLSQRASWDEYRTDDCI